MTVGDAGSGPAPAASAPRDLAPCSQAGSSLLALLVGAALMVTLAASVGAWGVQAATRLLDLLVEGGSVRLHDLHQGLIAGLPELASYWQALDPINWRSVVIAFLCFLGYEALKGDQFHEISRAYGIGGKLSCGLIGTATAWTAYCRPTTQRSRATHDQQLTSRRADQADFGKNLKAKRRT